MSETMTTCGRCGVYKHLHPIDRCKGYWHSRWWDRHLLHRHVVAWAWIHLLRPSWRWSICTRMATVGAGWRDWCQLVDCALKADEWSTVPNDYKGKWGCLCDFPLPWDVKAPDYGKCYCQPPPSWIAAHARHHLPAPLTQTAEGARPWMKDTLDDERLSVEVDHRHETGYTCWCGHSEPDALGVQDAAERTPHTHGGTDAPECTRYGARCHPAEVVSIYDEPGHQVRTTTEGA